MRSLAALILLAACSVAAQAPAPTQFDAATIKPAALPSGGLVRVGMRLDPTRLTASNVSLKQLIQRAYNLKPYQVQGPDWLDSERFDVTAETEQPVTQDQMAALLQPLLVKQFALITHRGSKVESIYALVAAPGGFKMTAPGPSGVSLPPPPRGARGGRMRLSGPLPKGAMQLMMSPQGLTIAGDVTLDSLANFLSSQVDRPVLNLTGIKGNYALHLTFAPTGAMRANMRKMGAPPPPPGAGSGGGSEPGGEAQAPAPSIFSALPQQLGLKLEPRKAPIEILVVDSASKVPKGN
ncbi:MAG: TIGR03435 family protein [Terriglobales bacterium]